MVSLGYFLSCEEFGPRELVRQAKMAQAAATAAVQHEGRFRLGVGSGEALNEHIFGVSASGPRSAEPAGRIGDGFCSTEPDADLVERFRGTGGRGKPAQAVFKASTLVTEEVVADALPAGPDPGKYVQPVREYVDAGCDEAHGRQIGPDQEAFFEFRAREVAPEVVDAT